MSKHLEGMNTLLDDNKVYQSTTGDKIPLHPTARVVILNSGEFNGFTPAHVSRLGMISLN